MCSILKLNKSNVYKWWWMVLNKHVRTKYVLYYLQITSHYFITLSIYQSIYLIVNLFICDNNFHHNLFFLVSALVFTWFIYLNYEKCNCSFFKLFCDCYNVEFLCSVLFFLLDICVAKAIRHPQGGNFLHIINHANLFPVRLFLVV